MSERIDAAALRDFSVSLCRAAGLPAEDAALLTDSIVFAECRGVTSHGLLRLPQYIARLRSGATAMNVHDGIRRHGAARRAERSRPARRAEGLRQGGGACRKIRRFVRRCGKLQPFRHGRMVRHPRSAARLFRFQYLLGGKRHGAARRGAAASRHRPGRAGVAARRGEGSPRARYGALHRSARQDPLRRAERHTDP